MPGTPFIENSGQEWKVLKQGDYNPATEEYSFSISVPDTYRGKVIIGATYQDTANNALEAQVTSTLDITDEMILVANVDLDNAIQDDVSFKVRLYVSDQEYDYSQPYRCEVTNSEYFELGRIIYLSNTEYGFSQNVVKGMPNGDYKVACHINELKRVLSFKLPLIDASGNVLADGTKYVDLKFDGTGMNGESF